MLKFQRNGLTQPSFSLTVIAFMLKETFSEQTKLELVGLNRAFIVQVIRNWKFRATNKTSIPNLAGHMRSIQT